MKGRLVVLICYILLANANHVHSIEFECENEGFALEESDNCGVYYYCVKSANNEFFPVKFKCPQGEEFSLLEFKCVPEDSYECAKLPEIPNDGPLLLDDFVCPSSGRFPNVESPDCKSYYVCSNILIPLLTNCPLTTIFSWVSMKCVASSDFTCPNKITTTTTDYEVTTQDYFTRETTDTANPSTESTTEQNVLTSSSPPSFLCTSNGRFSDPESIDCKGYYLCTENTEGFFEATLKQCPSITIFYPVSGKCVLPTEYECPTVQTTTTDPTEKPTTESTTEQNVLTSSSPPSFLCTSNGRFFDPESIDCKGYYLCTENTEGYFEATLKQCPSITIFYPASGKCVLPTEYECPTVQTTSTDPTEKPSTTVTTTSSTETSTLTTPPTTKLSTEVMISTTDVITATNEPSKNESFACTANGRFPDPASTDCRSFYRCTETTDGLFQTTLNQCPMDTIFHPENSKCVLPSSYHCSKEETTSPNPTEVPTTAETSVSSSVTSTITTPEPSTPVATSSTVKPTSLETTPSTTPTLGKFVCTSIGRHPDTTQPDCSKYKYCLLTATNVFLEYTFNCPTGAYFNALELRCSIGYNCPNVYPTVTPESTTDLSLMTTPFYCTSDGRFPDPTSKGCDTYITCIKTAVGNFQNYNFKCPNGSKFSPTESKCSTSYSCV